MSEVRRDQRDESAEPSSYAMPDDPGLTSPKAPDAAEDCATYWGPPSTLAELCPGEALCCIQLSPTKTKADNLIRSGSNTIAETQTCHLRPPTASRPEPATVISSCSYALLAPKLNPFINMKEYEWQAKTTLWGSKIPCISQRRGISSWELPQDDGDACALITSSSTASISAASSECGSAGGSELSSRVPSGWSLLAASSAKSLASEADDVAPPPPAAAGSPEPEPCSAANVSPQPLAPQAVIDILSQRPGEALSEEDLLRAASGLQACCSSQGGAVSLAVALCERLCSSTPSAVASPAGPCPASAAAGASSSADSAELRRRKTSLHESEGSLGLAKLELTTLKLQLSLSSSQALAAQHKAEAEAARLRSQLEQLQCELEAAAEAAATAAAADLQDSELGRILRCSHELIARALGCSFPEELVLQPVLDTWREVPEYADGNAAVLLVEDPKLAHALAARAQLNEQCAAEGTGSPLSPTDLPPPGLRADVLAAGARLAAEQPGSVPLNCPSDARFVLKIFPFASAAKALQVSIARAADPAHPRHQCGAAQLEHVCAEAVNNSLVSTLAPGEFLAPLMCATMELRGPCEATADADRQLVLVYPFQAQGDLHERQHRLACDVCSQVAEAGPERLAEEAREGARFLVQAATEGVKGIARVMAKVHEIKLVADDAKPTNFIVNDTGRIQGIDTAWMRQAEEGEGVEAKCRGAGVGTPGFLAPEREWLDLAYSGGSSDVHAAADSGFSMLETSRKVFRRQPEAMAAALLQALEVEVVESGLQAILDAGRRPEAFDRPTAGEVLRMLLELEAC
ncbi:hypothetical protein HYH03_006280 [Edaphochlamys debaryana]|uniref:Protein kinase domain-containing protein n=1 Tax=Edaphochlamys debaryana TaxID=47281 RepID=A0A835YB65_9CHLO|nr:hypothetical protein HYH03_006280 [Edaphochlamys debaryana]|eukprot:KAG2495680.1 hypothetical protein HYH03_006280 [Edaphochlamys debaryana]